ncbi:transposase [Lachnospiraceae bacterium PF1-22]|uniref:IS66 family transposase n=1 Tax=Ohessyouella blattaphilus TaxID=2949333 RepID=UPI003E1E9F0D
MGQKYTAEELNQFSKQELVFLVSSLQGQMETMNENLEKLIEQVRIANQQRFGRHTEKLDTMDGQLSFFNEAEYLSEENAEEPDIEEVLQKKPRAKKQKGKRDLDLQDFPEELQEHDVPMEKLDALFGEGCWRKMTVEEYKRLRYEPASWTVERHRVHVYVGTGGEHQDEFLRGTRPKDLLRNSILTPSLGAAIMNAKYVNSIPVARIEAEFERNDVHLSRQTMSDWIIKCSERYFEPLYQRLREKLLEFPVAQADETPVDVIRDDRSAGTPSYMWVFRSGEFYKETPIALYKYQKTRNSEHPKEFFKNYKGVVVTDGLSQYHKLDRELEGFTNANCMAHARRDYADAVKALGKSNPDVVKRSIAYQALARISSIYKLEGTLSDIPAEERLVERQATIKPLVEEYFTWIKERLSDTSCLPKGKTAAGLNYSVNQEKYLKVFLENGDVPIDNSASKRSLRTFCVGKKNWIFCNSIKGAQASAIVYSITETAKLNNLNPYYYLQYLLEEIPKLIAEDRTIDNLKLDTLLPWSKDLPEQCKSKRR